jgi:hypothetical protein
MLKNDSSVKKILRIRQTCCSALLVPSNCRELAMQLCTGLQDREEGAQKLTAEEGLELLEKLKGNLYAGRRSYGTPGMCGLFNGNGRAAMCHFANVFPSIL